MCNLINTHTHTHTQEVSLLISILRLNLVLNCRIAPEFRGGVYLFMQTAIRHRVSPEFIESCKSSLGRINASGIE